MPSCLDARRRVSARDPPPFSLEYVRDARRESPPSCTVSMMKTDVAMPREPFAVVR